MKVSVLVFDPGESTGWVYLSHDDVLEGGTLPKSHIEVANCIYKYQPDLVVLESFKLYPGKASSLSWNSFYPCEVIGVIKYICDASNIKYIEQAPSVKKFAGDFKEDWYDLKERVKTTEHTKDAYQHLKYFQRNGGRKCV